MTSFFYYLLRANMALPKSVLHYLKVILSPFYTERNDNCLYTIFL